MYDKKKGVEILFSLPKQGSNSHALLGQLHFDLLNIGFTRKFI